MLSDAGNVSSLRLLVPFKGLRNVSVGVTSPTRWFTGIAQILWSITIVWLNVYLSKKWQKELELPGSCHSVKCEKDLSAKTEEYLKLLENSPTFTRFKVTLSNLIPSHFKLISWRKSSGKCYVECSDLCCPLPTFLQVTQVRFPSINRCELGLTPGWTKLRITKSCSSVPCTLRQKHGNK